MAKTPSYMDRQRMRVAKGKKIELTVPHLYKCRPYQRRFWEARAKGLKRAVLVWHRRAGKEKTCWNHMIAEACETPGNYYYIFPDSKMGRRIIWDGVDKDGLRTLDHIPKELIDNINNVEMKIKLKTNSIVQIVGAHDPDSLRGTNPKGVVFSEYAEMRPKVYDEVISPILKENGGWAVFNFTPKGQNHAKELFDMAISNPDWFCERLTVQDTGAIPLDEIEKERREGRMSEDMIQQEYYCSFTLGIEGSYYAKYLECAKEEGRIGVIPYDKQSLVHTAWDIGYGDSTAIIFFQLVGNEIHVIDYYENHGEGLPHYAQVLQERRYIYGRHYAPHDIESHQFSTGLAAKSVGANLGISFVTLPTLRSRVEDGIEAVRGIFPRLWFDGIKCRTLLKALENYRKEFDEKHNCYRLKPLHDWSSHASDAARYMAMAVKIFVEHTKSPIDDKQAEKWYAQHNPVFG